MIPHTSQSPPNKLLLAYFVHDLSDAAVWRRVRMLHAGGLRVTVLGFRRTLTGVTEIDGAPTVDLGMTKNGRLAERAWSIGRRVIGSSAIRNALHASDLVMARNLESLILARRFGAKRRIVYECLDIHRTLLGSSFAARTIQWVETVAMRTVAMIVTSAPRFATDYFARRYPDLPVMLVENKLLSLDDTPRLRQPDRRSGAPPWVIGWFGMLRCARSFSILAELARASEGRIQILIAGRASDDVFHDFAALAAAAPGVRYVGAYRSDELAVLYGQVHFAWAIDFFEEGLNSAWLLPNRLYEAMAFGAVPIALAMVETGRWLAQHAVGLIVEDARTEVLSQLVNLDHDAYQRLRANVRALPDNLLVADAVDCRALVDAIVGGAAVMPRGPAAAVPRSGAR